MYPLSFGYVVEILQCQRVWSTANTSVNLPQALVYGILSMLLGIAITKIFKTPAWYETDEGNAAVSETLAYHFAL